MPAYLVRQSREVLGVKRRYGGDAMVVFAASGAIAKAMAAAKYGSDGAEWLAESTVATEIAVGANWIGWTFTLTIHGGFGEDEDEIFTHSITGSGASNDTIDEIGALFVTALNATDEIANAAYNATSNTLTVAGAADNLGDQLVTFTITPPNAAAPIVELVGTITDEGAEGDALSVVLPADAAVIPAFYDVLKQVT